MHFYIKHLKINTASANLPVCNDRPVFPKHGCLVGGDVSAEDHKCPVNGMPACDVPLQAVQTLRRVR